MKAPAQSRVTWPPTSIYSSQLFPSNNTRRNARLNTNQKPSNQYIYLNFPAWWSRVCRWLNIHVWLKAANACFILPISFGILKSWILLSESSHCTVPDEGTADSPAAQEWMSLISLDHKDTWTFPSLPLVVGSRNTTCPPYCFYLGCHLAGKHLVYIMIDDLKGASTSKSLTPITGCVCEAALSVHFGSGSQFWRNSCSRFPYHCCLSAVRLWESSKHLQTILIVRDGTPALEVTTCLPSLGSWDMTFAPKVWLMFKIQTGTLLWLAKVDLCLFIAPI